MKPRRETIVPIHHHHYREIVDTETARATEISRSTLRESIRRNRGTGREGKEEEESLVGRERDGEGKGAFAPRRTRFRSGNLPSDPVVASFSAVDGYWLLRRASWELLRTTSALISQL